MRDFVALAMFLVCIFTHSSVSTAEEESLLSFITTRQSVRWTQVPHRVMAFYYTWYGTPERHGRWVHWQDVRPDEHSIASSTHYPSKGAYDSHDPAIIDYHIDLAKAHGIDTFICTWWGQDTFDDRALKTVLRRAEQKDFSISIYWETVPGTGDDKINNAVDDLVYVLEEYGSHPAFLKVQGKPVVFVYGRVMNQVSNNEWAAIIPKAEKLHPEVFLLIADGYSPGYARVFDGLHVYNICTAVRDKSPREIREYAQNSFPDAVRTAKDRGKISCITIIPGYDDTKIRTPGINASRLDGQTYRVLWEQAIQADPDWVVITSWNEWHEGSEIEPSREHGEQYVQITGECAARFKSKQYSQVPVATDTLGPTPEHAELLRNRFRGKTVGILPDFQSDAILWLAETGVQVTELTWDDVLDDKLFNPGAFPVVVFAGGERYCQSREKDGDVDDAIIRYLRNGGMLMTMSIGPFPFFSNEKAEIVRSSGKFGLPIVGSVGQEELATRLGKEVLGWERPPKDISLAFHINKAALKTLPERVPYPEGGDLRWRPLDFERLDKDDVYIPLVRLQDSTGKNYGDAAGYIEHRVSSPHKGKNIYVWKRVTDLLNNEDFLFELFSFAAEKLE